MAVEWVRHEVSALIRAGALVIGDGYRAKNSELTRFGLPFARAGNINAGFLFDDADCFPEEHLERVGNKVSVPGDVVFTSKGTVGRFGFVRPDTPRFVYSPQLCFWRCVDHQLIDPRFLSFWMSGREFFVQFKGVAGQTDMAEYVSLTDQRRMHITLPPLLEQRAIAHILGALDDKIELHRRMNETLEAMARALFKSWFVDFDPVRAKAEGRDAGLPKHIADLFPDSFEESELGETPQGWRFRALGELVTLTRGRTYKGALKELPGPVLLGLASIERNGGFRDDKLSTYGGDSPAELVLGPGELFASLKDVTQSADLLGAVARVPLHIPSGRLTQDTVRLNFRSPTTSKAIVYRTLLAPAYREYCRAHATGTTNLGLSREDFLAYPVVQPTEAIQLLFDDVVGDLESRCGMATAERRTLTTTRDALLPKLISGELRVNEMASEAR